MALSGCQSVVHFNLAGQCFLPGARPANSRTRRPANGGAAVILAECVNVVICVDTMPRTN